MLLENKNTAFSLQFDSYCSATKKHFFVKAILLLTNEPTLVCENLLCYLAKNIPFASLLIILHSESTFNLPPKSSKNAPISPQNTTYVQRSKNARDVKLVVDWHTAC